MRSIENQDRATGLGLFVDGEVWVAAVPPHDRFGEQTRASAAARYGYHPDRLHILKVCNDHPDTPAVDCLVCAPDE